MLWFTQGVAGVATRLHGFEANPALSATPGTSDQWNIEDWRGTAPPPPRGRGGGGGHPPPPGGRPPPAGGGAPRPADGGWGG